MLHIVFSDSEKGVLKSLLSKIMIQNNNKLFEAAQDVFKINVALDIGPINCKFNDISRKNVITSIIKNDMRETEEVINEKVERYWKFYLKDYQTVINRAQNGEPMCIWYSEAPYSICGFYATIEMAAEWNTSVSAVKLPHLICDQGKYKHVVGWGNIPASEWMKYRCLKKEYTNEELIVLSKEWNRLKIENSLLRAVINGYVHSVSNNFYDTYILNAINQQPLLVSEAILKTISMYSLGVSDFLIAKRINEMLNMGELQVVKKNNFFYNYLIKKTSKDKGSVFLS